MEGASPQEPGLKLAHADRRPRRWGRWGMVFMAILPAVLPLYVIWNYHVNFIWNDAWDVANLLVKSHRGTLQLADFWAPHLEHRMPVPYLIMFVLARFTLWNTYVEVLFGYLIVCLLSGLLAMLLRSTQSDYPEDRGRGGWVWRWFLINVLIFSPIQGENWIFGFTACQNFIAVPCMVGAMVLILRRGVTWRTVLIAALLIEIAVCSQANGMLGWFVILALLVAGKSPRELRGQVWCILGWLGLTGLSIATYFVGYAPKGVVKSYYVASLVDRIKFFFAFLGTPLCVATEPQDTLALCLGLILMVSYLMVVIVVIRRIVVGDSASLRRSVPWLALGGYAVANAAMAAWGRAGMGLAAAATTRYTTISICLLICFVGLLPLLASLRLFGRKLTSFGPAFSGLLLVALGISGFRTRATYTESAHERRAGLAHLSFIRILSEPLGGRLITYDPKLGENALALNQLGYLHPPLINEPTINRLEAPGWGTDSRMQLSGNVDGARQASDGAIQIWGWAVLHEQSRLADAVLITYDTPDGDAVVCAIGDVYAPVDYQIPVIGKGRPDTKFVAVVPLRRLPMETRRLRCWAYDAERQRAYPLTGVALQTGNGSR